MIHRSPPFSTALSLSLSLFALMPWSELCVAIARYVRRSNFHVECCSFIICTFLIGSLKWVILLGIKHGEVRDKILLHFILMMIDSFVRLEDRRALLSVYCAPYIVLLGQKYLRRSSPYKRTIISVRYRVIPRPLGRVKICKVSAWKKGGNFSKEDY